MGRLLFIFKSKPFLAFILLKWTITLVSILFLHSPLSMEAMINSASQTFPDNIRANFLVGTSSTDYQNSSILVDLAANNFSIGSNDYLQVSEVIESKDYPSDRTFEEMGAYFSHSEKIDYQIDTSILPQNNYTILAAGGKIGDYTDTFRIDSFPIVVKNIPQTIDAKFGLAKICINISHRRVSDLKVELLSPDGSSIWLTNRNGGDEGMSYMSTCFRSNGFNGYIHQGKAPFTGEYIPDGRLEFLNNGQNPNGTWHLLIRDLRANQTGQLHLVSLDFEKVPMPNLGVSPCNFENPSACRCANQLRKK